MLLQRLKEYADTQPGAAPFHRERRFAWQLELDSAGRLRSTTLTPLVETDAKGKPRGVTHRVPEVTRTSGVAANLATGEVQYVLGWPDDDTRPDRVTRCHTAFVELIERWAASDAAASDPIPAAVATFCRSGELTTLVRPDSFSAKDGVVIMVGGALAHQAPSAVPFWAEEVARRKGSSRVGRCLVCGEHRPLLDTVPGTVPQHLVPGATMPPSLVSINAPVFGYDLSEKLIATPLCITCGEAMTAGLHRLLESPRNTTTASGQDSKLAWWVTGGSDHAISLAVDPAPNPDEIVRLLQSLQHNNKPADDEGLGGTFHSVTVGGNVARIVVRDWVEMPLPAVEANIARWFRDHEIASARGGTRHFSLGRLAMVTGRWQRSLGGYVPFGNRADGRPVEIYRDLMRCALRGTPLPRSVLTHVLGRIRADHRIDDARAALIRLALIRSTSQEAPMPGLDPTNTDTAYVAGRLFAAYEQLQYDAHNPPGPNGKRPGTEPNVTFADRYLSGAIVNPRAALLTGVRDSRAWLKKLRRGHAGLATNNEKSILALHELLGGTAEYPNRLTSEQQGRFAIGYHHQRAHQFAQRSASRDTPIVQDTEEISAP